jgi:cell wall-associated NlpC family hydrolase
MIAPHSGRLVRWASLLLLLTTSACATSGKLATEPFEPPYETAGTYDPALYPAAEHAPVEAGSEIERRLRAEVASWEGTPHVLGGNDRRGLDCSAFVASLYDRLFDVRLPRTTQEQVAAGHAVSQSELQPGDLVFFQPPTKSRHVGIYLNKGEFAHVSSSQGVTVSHLDQRYWKDAFWTSRRVLSDPTPRYADAERVRYIGSAPRFEEPPPDEPRRTRIGW